jgi:hypothetical protein
VRTGILSGDTPVLEGGPAVADLVTLTLAYPLSAEQAERVLAQDVKDYWVGDKITVRRDYAMSVIGAGYAAGVDPGDKEAVQAALSAGQVSEKDPDVTVDDSGPKVVRSHHAKKADD